MLLAMVRGCIRWMQLNRFQPIILTNFARPFIYYIITTTTIQVHLLTD